ncbi:MAG: tetratricopeptide repeat protein [Leptolyngbya sp. SIOISBB]|nr:tetratricopeptide repeat protein [Leptolyngbya sp. SIOISBB]
MSYSDLEKALDRYIEILKALKNPDSHFEDTCLNVLILRDEIQSLLEDHSPSARKVLPRLVILDDCLKQQGKAIAQAVPLDKWREIINPPESAWWWHLKAPKPIRSWNQLDWLYEALAVPIHTFNFALVVAISSRFLIGGPDNFGALAVILQSAVAMFAAGAPLTKSGQQVIERLLTTLNIPKYWWQEAKLAMTFAVFLCLWGLQSSLPLISQFYVWQGAEAQIKQKTTQALEKYERAVELDANNAEAHFRLGSVYEELLDIDQAQAEYRIAMLGGCIEAYVNLARLELVQEQDPAAAGSLLRQGKFQLDNSGDDITYCSQSSQLDRSVVEFSFFVNFGWVYLVQERLNDSESQLREALKINNDEAAPHCLLAQVKELRMGGDTFVALEEWRKCADYARALNSDEDRWLNMAQQRLSQPD